MPSGPLAHICLIVEDLDKAVDDWTKILTVMDPGQVEEQIVRYDEFTGGEDEMRWATFVSHGGANLANQRSHDCAAPVEKRPETSVGAHIGQPEGFAHVVGKIDVARKISLDVADHLASQRLGPDPRPFGARHAMRAPNPDRQVHGAHFDQRVLAGFD